LPEINIFSHITVCVSVRKSFLGRYE
jgi:hypothetical protein